MNNKTITIGALTVSIQAFITALSGIALGILLMIVLPGNLKLIGLISSLLILMSAYTVNCTVVGNCVVWAWVLTVMSLSNVITFFMLAFTSKKHLREMYSITPSPTVFTKKTK